MAGRPKAEPATEVRIPTKATLDRYGMALEEWTGILVSQGGVCAICRRIPPSGRMVVDHHHVPRWKHMHPKQRRMYVRGLVCFYCNGKCVSRHMTLAKARAIVSYLQEYEARLKSDLERWGKH